jgi:hypothetical protein
VVFNGLAVVLALMTVVAVSVVFIYLNPPP